jgi:hypothetical protein
MTLELDNLGVNGKRTLVMVSTIVLLALSHVSYGLRLWARKSTTGRFQLEDWLMGGALFFSYGTAVCQFYGTFSWPLFRTVKASAHSKTGLTVGLGEHIKNVSSENVKQLSFVCPEFFLVL